jgi:Lactonase, 7-bladed beta-propeller
MSSQSTIVLQQSQTALCRQSQWEAYTDESQRTHQIGGCVAFPLFPSPAQRISRKATRAAPSTASPSAPTPACSRCSTKSSRLTPPALDNTGKVLLVANYASGDVASFAVKGEESIGERTGFDQPTGFQREPSSARGTPAHEVVFSPGNRFPFVPDLGTDQIQDMWVDAGHDYLNRFHLICATD